LRYLAFSSCSLAKVSTEDLIRFLSFLLLILLPCRLLSTTRFSKSLVNPIWLEAREEDPIIVPPFLVTHLAISPYQDKKKLCVLSPLPITSPCESLTTPSAQSNWKQVKIKIQILSFLDTDLIVLSPPWWNLLALTLVFATSPCKSRDEILFKGGSSVTP
jgi:hypothetical protein